MKPFNQFQFAIGAISLLLLGATACAPQPQPTPTATHLLPSPTLTVLRVTSTPTTPLSPPPPPSPIPTVPATPVPTTAPPIPTVPATRLPHAVILVSANDVLNVRRAAGPDNPIVDRLSPHATNILLTGNETTVGTARWVEILRAAGGTGWVNAHFLTEWVPPAAFCADGRVNTLLANLATAMTTSNGPPLATLVSPPHGMNVHYLRGGAVANYSPAEARAVFDSTYVFNWGRHPASGLEVRGTFRDEVLPKLVDVLGAQHTTTCNRVVTGGATYTPAWPFEYRNINYYSLFRPGPPGNELDWRTWVVGVEYVGRQPYVFALLQFTWEP